MTQGAGKAHLQASLDFVTISLSRSREEWNLLTSWRCVASALAASSACSDDNHITPVPNNKAAALIRLTTKPSAACRAAMAASCARPGAWALHKHVLVLWAVARVHAEQGRRGQGPDQDFGLLGCQAADHDSPGVVCAGGQGLLQLLRLPSMASASAHKLDTPNSFAHNEPEAASPTGLTDLRST